MVLSSEIIHICKNSGKGCNKIYEDKMKFNESLPKTCEEFKLEATTDCLSGGEDYELLFTINQKIIKKLENDS